MGLLGFAVCSTFILHFQQEILSSSGWLSTKSFEHDKVDIVQIFIRLKIVPVVFGFLSDPLWKIWLYHPYVGSENEVNQGYVEYSRYISAETNSGTKLPTSFWINLSITTSSSKLSASSMAVLNLQKSFLGVNFRLELTIFLYK